MSRILITGSTDGLGFMAARLLIEQGHRVVLHARNPARARQVQSQLPAAEATIIGDLSSIDQTRSVAAQANASGAFDAIIHNAGIGDFDSPRAATAEDLPQVLAVNTLAPYILTALVQRAKRYVFVSSGMHRGVGANLGDMAWVQRPWQGSRAYAESKLYDVMLAFAIARRWPQVLSNALEPGWVPTKMGGVRAPDDLDQGHRTQVWLATSEEAAARVSGQYFYHLQPHAVANTN